MKKYIIRTSSKRPKVYLVEAEETDYDMMKCKFNKKEIFVKKTNCYDTESKANEVLKEIEFISNFKSIKRNKKHKVWRCDYCGKILKNKNEVTVDHIKPKSKGGLTELSNLCISCEMCNKSKSSKHKTHYLKLMERNDRLKMKNPNKFNGKVRGLAHKRHHKDAESIARMDSNMISPRYLTTKKPVINLVDKALQEHSKRFK